MRRRVLRPHVQQHLKLLGARAPGPTCGHLVDGYVACGFNHSFRTVVDFSARLRTMLLEDDYLGAVDGFYLAAHPDAVLEIEP